MSQGSINMHVQLFSNVLVNNRIRTHARAHIKETVVLNLKLE